MHKRQKIYNAIILIALLTLIGFMYYNMKLLQKYISENRNIVSIPGPVGSPGQPGLRGFQGIQGVQGLQGPQGETGPQGPRGDTGMTGLQGPQGIQGKQGIQGEKGDTGPQGEPGVSGREIEVRHNDEQDRTEWRYVGDEDWQVLVEDCEITDTCL